MYSFRFLLPFILFITSFGVDAQHVAVIQPGDTPKDIIRKAAHVTPSPRQLRWQQLELTAFFHFGVNTFTNREWGTGEEDPKIFNPSNLDAEQWVRTAKEAGIKQVILTAKHHDGFCLWPTAVTEYSVKSSPWKDGKGDLVKEVADACKKYDIGFGVYLSPWDRNAKVYGTPEYNDFFVEQLTELLTKYGQIDEVWFDGANGEGPNGKKQVYDFERWYQVIRKLQPSAVIAVMGPDVRWVGTETGYGRETEWSVVPMNNMNLAEIAAGSQQDATIKPQGDMRAGDVGSRDKIIHANGLAWYPAETDVSIRPGWFYHPQEDDKVKSPEKLLDIYYSSVGRNGVLLLNIPPDTRGLVHENDIKALKEWKHLRDETFATNFAVGATIKVSNGKHKNALFDSDYKTYFTTKGTDTTTIIELELKTAQTFDVLMLQENIAVGQRIEKFSLDYWSEGTWKRAADGTTVGYKRLLRFTPVTTKKVRINIESSRLNPTLSEIGLFKNALSVVAKNPIIPRPVEAQTKPGVFTIDAQTVLKFKDKKRVGPLATYFQKHIHQISSFSPTLNGKGKHEITFVIRPIDSIGEEGYLLDVSPTNVLIEANTEKGLFYGVQSLLQLLPAVRTNEPLSIPAMKIKDYPRIGWRGMMLDVSRHFYTVDALKEIIDLLALYKMNVFHWHLTDNEGWRLEIKKYPRLTETGAWRNEVYGSIWYTQDSSLNWKDTYRYGGYYMQDQAREIVAYAAARNITVIPEIEMPGHSGAVLAAYPQFSCNQNPQPVPNSAIFNKFNPAPSRNHEYCAGNDSVFVFLQDVLKEVMAIFPSEYIHIGGDEVDKTHWKSCAKCQKRIQDEKLKDVDELQSYFIQRMEKFLLANNRKMLGWDEILEGGLAPSATVMSWRGEKGGIEAAKMGHDVIMAPSDPLYFNRYQTDPEGEPLAAKFSINTLERVYNYDPYTKALNNDQLKYIKGVQFAIWTEFIGSQEHLEYMLLPRLPAIAEAAWTPLAKKDFTHFTTRLNSWHFDSWLQQGIRFNRLFLKK